MRAISILKWNTPIYTAIAFLCGKDSTFLALYFKVSFVIVHKIIKNNTAKG